MTRCVLLALMLVATACNRSESSAGEGAGKPAEAASAGPRKIEKLGLTAALSEDALIGDGLDEHSVLINAVDGVALNVGLAKDSAPKTVEDQKKENEAFNPTDVADAKLADGWVLTWKNSGSAGANHWFQVRREINGKAYICDGTLSSAEAQKAAVDICKSLE